MRGAGAAALIAGLLVAACTPVRHGVFRTGYRLSLDGHASALESRDCLHACWVAHGDGNGFFDCLRGCPRVVVRPRGCRPDDRPPAALCVEEIGGTSGGSASLADLEGCVAELVRLAEPVQAARRPRPVPPAAHPASRERDHAPVRPPAPTSR